MRRTYLGAAYGIRHALCIDAHLSVRCSEEAAPFPFGRPMCRAAGRLPSTWPHFLVRRYLASADFPAIQPIERRPNGGPAKKRRFPESAADIFGGYVALALPSASAPAQLGRPLRRAARRLSFSRSLNFDCRSDPYEFTYVP